MPGKKRSESQESMLAAITGAFLDKKAEEPVMLDFRSISGSICDAFMICHGTSRTQVEALANHVIDQVKQKTGSNPWHKEGFENSEWILIDYADVVVHVFQEDRRRFYNLEQLWADAPQTRLETGIKKSIKRKVNRT